MKPIRVLVVDDSATMRGLITATLTGQDDIEVVGAVGDAFAARQSIKALNPDVVTLDVEMPEMNGLEFLEKIMRLRPMPVVMVSTLTQAGAEVTLKALEIGAVDCVAKPKGGEGFPTLADAVRGAAHCRVRPLPPRPQPPVGGAALPAYRSNGRIVGIGSSTGGVEALFSVLSAYPKDCPPTIITQHMPAGFTRSFADRLNRTCPCEVVEAFDGAPIRAGHVYIAPGGETHLTVAGAHNPVCRLEASDPVNRHRPSVDVMFDSIARTMGGASVGVILTGMGRDGAEALLRMRQAGARTIGQDESSCVVYGMPKSAFEIGAVERQAPLERIGKLILDLCAHELREAH
jgi:two-component system chemotaxis response regulator CheB